MQNVPKFSNYHLDMELHKKSMIKLIPTLWFTIDNGRHQRKNWNDKSYYVLFTHISYNFTWNLWLIYTYYLIVFNLYGVKNIMQQMKRFLKIWPFFFFAMDYCSLMRNSPKLQNALTVCSIRKMSMAEQQKKYFLKI